MARPRTVPHVVPVMTHGGVMKDGIAMTESAIHTVQLNEGHFACIVMSRPDGRVAAVAYLDRDEVEAHIQLLRNAMEDAERLDQGLAPIHAAPTLVRQ